jgi:hypothetical protein
MFSREVMRAVEKASRILTELANAGHGWQIGNAKPHPLPWGSPEHIGLTFNRAQNEVTADKLAWLQERGWIAQVFNDRIVLAPLVFVERPENCFHATPAENVSGILKDGLRTGALAGRSTSKRKDCESHIYVSLDLESARKWAEGRLLGKTNPGQEWGLIMLDARGLTGQLFRDPASSTGYMLEDKHVPAIFLRLAEEFRPHR